MRALVILCVLGVACTTVPSGAAATSKAAKVTFVGDSVSASLEYVPGARRLFGKGLRVTFDLRVCRRLVAPSCAYQGTAPSPALDAIRGYGHSLGDVLVVNVGYNEAAGGYREGIDRVMQAALAQGAKGVVWVTLRESRAMYHASNIAIRAAAKRWPQLVVADWNLYARGHPWFGSDGLHLTTAGATALAEFVRRHVMRIA